MTRGELTSRAASVAREVLAVHADDVDAEERFPHEAVRAMGEAGLLELMIPRRLGGLSGSFADLAAIGTTLGAACLSSAMVWAMHCQQAAVLSRHGTGAHEFALEAVAGAHALLASVTTERGKGGDLGTAHAPLERTGDAHVRVQRDAPVVSYGAEARFFCVLMRASPDSPPQDVRLVLLDRNDPGDVSVTGPWTAHGMRGTRSVPMRFDVVVPAARIIGDARAVTSRTMIPAGHIGWAAAWHGAASGAFSCVVEWCRSRRSGPGFESELVRDRLASLRVSLDLVDALLERTARRFDAIAQEAVAEVPARDLIQVNNLKLAASECSRRVVDELVELVGMPQGYLRSGSLALERVLRDLRSASLMFSNERLRQINGRLIAIEPGRDASDTAPRLVTPA